MHWPLYDNATDVKWNDITETTTFLHHHHLPMTHLLLPLLALESVLAVRCYEEVINKSTMEPLYLLVDLNPTQRLIYLNSKQDSKNEWIEYVELEKLNMPNIPV